MPMKCLRPLPSILNFVLTDPISLSAQLFVYIVWNFIHCYFKKGKYSHLFINWASTWQNQQNECAPSEDSDQPGHQPSLIRVFAVRIKKPWVLSYLLSAQRRLWSDWADAQADLSLHWAHTFCWFCHIAAQLLYYILSFADNRLESHQYSAL